MGYQVLTLSDKHELNWMKDDARALVKASQSLMELVGHDTSPVVCPASHSSPRHITPRAGGRLATSPPVVNAQYCLTELRMADRGGLLR